MASPRNERRLHCQPLPNSTFWPCSGRWAWRPSEVHDELGNDNRYTTTLKTIQLMTEKGLLTRGERFGSHVYEPSVPKEQTQRQIAGDLLKRAFGGSARSLVMGALAAQPASRAELHEIRGMLDSLAPKKGSSS